MGFEKQSQHIISLLAELQEKESILLNQGEELQRCRQELDELKVDDEEKKMRRAKVTVKEMEHEDKMEGRQEGERPDETSVDSSEAQPDQEKEFAVPLLTTRSKTDYDGHQSPVVTSEKTFISSEVGTAFVLSESQHRVSVDYELTQGTNGSALLKEEIEYSQDGGASGLGAEPLTPKHDNQLLKQRSEALMISDTNNRALHSNTENQEDKNTGSCAPSCCQSQLQTNVSQDEGRDVGRDNINTEELPEEESRLQIHHLQQQVAMVQ